MRTVFLLILLTALLPAQERSRRNPYTSPEDVAAGARLYRPLCSNCHGRQGQGWPGFTPNLAGGIQRASSDVEVLDLLLNGLPGTEMPAFTLTEREGWQLVAFVRAFADRDAEISGDASRGAALFREKGCIGCHRVGDEGGRLGPDLRAAAAVSSPEKLRQAITDPAEEVHPRRYRVRAVTARGDTVEGIRLNEDTFSIQTLTADGRLRALDKTGLRELEILTDSPMPSFRERLRDDELNDLVAFVAGLAENQP